MFGKIKNSFRRTQDDTSRRRSEDSNTGSQPPQQPQTGIFSNDKLNESNTSISSVTSSFKPRNIFRRSKMPMEFTQPPPVPRIMSPTPPQVGDSPPHRALSVVAEMPSPPREHEDDDSSPRPSYDINNTPVTQQQQQQHIKSPSGGSVRSILRDRSAPGTGRSVRWNGTDSTRIITPDASVSTSASTDQSVETVRTNLLSRLEDSTDEDDDGEQDRRHQRGSRIPSPQKGEEDFPSLLDSDPFAANTPTSSHHKRTESTSSAISAVSSTMEMNEPPSSTTNLLDMSDEPPSIALTDSFENAGAILAQFPPLQPDSPSFGEGERPTSADFDVQTPRASMYQFQSTVTETPVTVRDFPTTPSPPKSNSPSSGLRPSPQQHARMPSETPTLRPVRQSPLKAMPDSPEQDKSLSPLPSTPDASVYHTPGNQTAREHSKSPITFYSFSQPNSPTGPPLPPPKDDDYMPPFLVPNVEEEARGSEVLNSAFTVPNNSLTIPSQTIANHDDTITQLQQKLELYVSLSEQYEADLSARDDLVDELSVRISKADEEVAAWRGEADRTTRRFEKMRSKVSALAATCEQLTTQRQQASLFDKASSAALQQLHQRVGSLDASRVALEEKIRILESERDAERARAEKAEKDKDDTLRKYEAAEEDGKYWRERSHEYERSGQELIEQLNSLGDTSMASLGSSMMRPGSLSIMTIDEVVRSAAAGTPTAVEGQFPRASAGSDLFKLHLPVPDIDPVYVLKSEIIKREQEYEELREQLRTFEFTSAEERIAHSEAKAALEAELAQTQQQLTLINAELQSQYANVDRMNEEITCLEEEKQQLLEKASHLAELEQQTYSMRLDASDKEVLASELETTLERVGQLERERAEALKTLDAERGALETSNEELRAAEHEVAELNAQLNDQRERAEFAEARLAELERKLGTLDTTSEEFVRAKEDWSAREKWLLDNANDMEERMQRLQIIRDKLLRELQDEKQGADELALAHSTLQHQSADMAKRLQLAKDEESHREETVQSLQQQLSEASDAIAERERQCQALEELHSASEHALKHLRSCEASACEERESALAELSAATEARARLNAMLESANTRLRDVQRQNADLEIKNVQLAKAQKQLEDDNAGLYIGLEAKQQELEMVKRKFGVRGIAGSTPAQASAARFKDSAFKVPNPRRSSVSSVAETDDGDATKIPTVLAGKGLPRTSRPRMSIATPTPAVHTANRHPALSNHARKTSSSSTLSSVAGAQPGAAPVRPPGLRRPESSSDADSVSSAAPAKRLIRPLPNAKANASGSSVSPPSSFKRSSVSPNPETSLLRSSISRRMPSQSAALKSTPEESEKENQAPANLPDDSTPKPSALRRRVMIAA